MATFGLPDYGPDHDNSNEPQMKPISDVEKDQIINGLVLGEGWALKYKCLN